MKLFEYFKMEDVENLKKISISEFYEFYDKQKETLKSSKSFNSLIRSLSAFFNWLMATEIIR